MLPELPALLAPFADFGPELAVAVEDLDGRRVAGEVSPADVIALAPIGLPAAPLGRVVVRGREAPGVAPAARVLAAALGALATASGMDSRAAEERARIEAELAVGRRLQRSFVPLVAPEVAGWALASHYVPAREVGGDFFDTFRPRGRPRELALVIADVTGKGIAAALLMAFARPLIRAAIDHARKPSVALERTNTILVVERRAALFITALAIYVDTRTGEFVVANAGHEPPLILRTSGELEDVDASGPLLGAFSGVRLEERAGVLEPGDLLLLYTDGVTDARAPDGTRFGDDRLRAIVQKTRDAPVREVIDAIDAATRAFQADEPAADDVTLVAVRRLSVP